MSDEVKRYVWDIYCRHEDGEVFKVDLASTGTRDESIAAVSEMVKGPKTTILQVVGYGSSPLPEIATAYGEAIKADRLRRGKK